MSDVGMRRRTIRPLLVIAAAVTTGWLPLGCTSAPANHVATAVSASVAASRDPSAPATNADDRMRQYAQCLRGQGLDVPDPAPGAGVRLDPKAPADRTDAAVKACARYAGAADAPHPPSAADLEALRRYAGCMRDHGVANFPDPDPQTGFFNGLDKSSYDANSPTVRAAQRTCQSLQPPAQSGG